MKLKYLGTAAAEGWPALFCRCEYCLAAKAKGGDNIRTRSQAILDDIILFDLPPDTYLHMVQDNLDLPNIFHVLITHTHQDHFYPEELLFRCGGFAHGVEGPLTVYGNKAVAEKMNALMKQYQYDADSFKDRVQWKELKAFNSIDVNGYLITPLLASHDTKEPCFIYLVEKEGYELLYGHDTGVFPEDTWNYLLHHSLSLVSLDCTMGRFSEGRNHLGIPNVLDVKQRLISSGIATAQTRFVASHFSHNGHLLHCEIEALLLPHSIIPAHDGFEIEV